MIQKKFSGKVALITGGTRGIGKSIALKLASEGCDVAINFLTDHESAAEAVEELKQYDVKCLAIQAHIGHAESRVDLWSQFDKTFHHLDFLIANAATGVFKPATELTLNSLRKVFAVNTEALLDLSHEALRRMPKGEEPYEAGNKGRIVAVSSIGAERVIPNYASIGATKAAMEALIRQLAYELGPLGVNCNVVRAGLVDTGLLNYTTERDQIIQDTIHRTPNGRLVNSDDVAEVVSFMLTEGAAMINGQTLMVDGGHGLIA